MKSKVVALISLLLVILFLYGAQTGQSQSTEVDVEVAPEMGDVPTDCGHLAESMAIDPMIPQAIGAWPIWVALPNGGDDTKGILYVPNAHYQRNTDLEGWWSTKVAWFIPKSYSGDVQLEGFNVDDNSPMYFEFDHPQTTVATINPEQPGGFVDGLDNWAFFPSYVWVSKAGCYRIEAMWDGGRWEQVIAVGKVE